MSINIPLCVKQPRKSSSSLQSITQATTMQADRQGVAV